MVNSTTLDLKLYLLAEAGVSILGELQAGKSGRFSTSGSTSVLPAVDPGTMFETPWSGLLTETGMQEWFMRDLYKALGGWSPEMGTGPGAVADRDTDTDSRTYLIARARQPLSPGDSLGPFRRTLTFLVMELNQ